MSRSNPGIYIPTLYFAEGLPYTIVMMMSALFFKTLGSSNEFIGLTSLLYLPWSLKLFWAPLVDLLGLKRSWILSSQLVLAILMLLLAFSTLWPQVVHIALFLFAVIALTSATQDVAIDGFYMDALDKQEQAFYVGIRNTAYKLAWLFGSGGLVVLAGKLGESIGIARGWGLAFAFGAMLFFALALFHYRYLPQPARAVDGQAVEPLNWREFLRVFSTYFNQPGIVAIVVYILTFRLGDALMIKMQMPFLIDQSIKGGLGMSAATIGLIYGTVGTTFLLLGGILGGWLVARDGLRKWLWPTAIIQNSAILLYWYLAVWKPSEIQVAAVNAVEQFSYGLGVAAYTVFLLTTVKSHYKAAHYATATAMMALGMMLPGVISGYLQERLGYAGFFLLSFVAALPGIVAIFFLPLRDLLSSGSNEQA